jgi:hypothetical protein
MAEGLPCSLSVYQVAAPPAHAEIVSSSHHDGLPQLQTYPI